MREAELFTVVVENAEQIQLFVVVDFSHEFPKNLAVLCLVGDIEYFAVELEAVAVCRLPELFHDVKHVEVVVACEDSLLLQLLESVVDGFLLVSEHC